MKVINVYKILQIGMYYVIDVSTTVY
jgi:hypothetical protein